jgi:hypothetical protein
MLWTAEYVLSNERQAAPGPIRRRLRDCGGAGPHNHVYERHPSGSVVLPGYRVLPQVRNRSNRPSTALYSTDLKENSCTFNHNLLPEDSCPRISATGWQQSPCARMQRSAPANTSSGDSVRNHASGSDTGLELRPCRRFTRNRKYLNMISTQGENPGLYPVGMLAGP